MQYTLHQDDEGYLTVTQSTSPAGLQLGKRWSDRAAEVERGQAEDEHSTYSWLLEPMLERVGFEIAEREVSPSRTFAACVCLRGP